MQIELSPEPDEALRLGIHATLRDFNEAQAGPSGYQHLGLAVRDSGGALCGGLWGHTGYGWLYIQLLAVPESARGQGLGTRLMHAAETEALRRGCHHAWVDTIFGARPFYERLGYRVFGELPNYTGAFTRSFLSKSLHPSPEPAA